MIRPIRIRIRQTMGGPIFSVKCRACDRTVGDMANLDFAFERAEIHIGRHHEQIVQETAEEMGLVSQR